MTWYRKACRLALRGILILAAAGGTLLFIVPGAVANPSGLTQGAWRAVQPGETPAQALQAASLGEFHRFDPSHLTRIPRDGLGTWVVLQPPVSEAPGQRILSIPSPPFGTVALYDADGLLNRNAITETDPALPAHGRIAFMLPQDMSVHAPILLKFEPSTALNAPVNFHLQSPQAFRQVDTKWLVMASASLAVMLAMGLMALCFAAMLRDATFAWYALYVWSYAGLQSVQTGFLFQPLHLTSLAPVALPVGVTLTAISVASAVLFMVRFCDLRRYAPWLRRLMLAMALMVALVAGLDLTPYPAVRDLVHVLFNPLLALSAGLMVVTSSIALLRGSRAAMFFLFGWLPLLVLTALTSAQVGGALPDVDWLNQASLAAGAIEALVLAVGLADRTLNLRRDHNLARELADKDPLTGIFNRRGWIDAAEKSLADGRTHTLLFMDLDHFKTLNDQLGHVAGDYALASVAQNLKTELRPQDLIGRFGGEEFVALLHATDRDKARLVAERLCRRLHRMEIPLDREDHFLTISIGMATRRPHDSLSSLVERADTAMYMAKSQGRNRVVDDSRVEHPRQTLLRPAGPAGSSDATEPVEPV